MCNFNRAHFATLGDERTLVTTVTAPAKVAWPTGFAPFGARIINVATCDVNTSSGVPRLAMDPTAVGGTAAFRTAEKLARDHEAGRTEREAATIGTDVEVMHSRDISLAADPATDPCDGIERALVAAPDSDSFALGQDEDQS